MKRILRFTFLSLVVFSNTAVFSQTDSTSNLVYKKVADALLKGDCDKAQSYYNIWKELTSKRDASIEVAIQECKNENKDYIELRAAGIAIQKMDVTKTPVDFESADKLCDNSILGGFSNWRLPTEDELATIYTTYSTQNVIEGFNLGYYWSYTRFPEISSSSIDILNFGDGTIKYVGKTEGGKHYCRCVRTLP